MSFGLLNEVDYKKNQNQVGILWVYVKDNQTFCNIFLLNKDLCLVFK